MFDLQNHPDWKHIEHIKTQFLKSGFKIYLVGGCVRDLLLQRKPKDFDFATSAKPEEMQALFAKTNDVGKAFGTIQVVLDKSMFEITTFRKDLDYIDGRHPDSVSFSDEIEDAKRRDFTMNALFYDLEKNEIVDHVNGRSDIDHKIIRFIGDAEKRIDEDKLRLLRALRFVSALGFDLEPTTAAAVKAYATKLDQVSQERIFEEMTKLISGDFFHRSIPYLRDTNILSILFDNKLDQTKLKDFLDISRSDFYKLQVAFELENSLLFSILFYGMLLKSEQFDWRKWRWSKGLYSSVLLFRLLVKRMHQKLSKVDILQVLQSLEGNLYFIARDKLKMHIDNEVIIRSHYGDKLPFEVPLPEPLVNGQDLIDLGEKPSKSLGEKLERLYAIQLENEVLDKKLLLESYSKTMK